jgi:hypothetical protein
VTVERRRYNRVSPQRQAQHDQLLAALRDAGPAGLTTSECGKALTRECLCKRTPPRLGGRCYSCGDTGQRAWIGSEVITLLYQLEKRELVTGERGRPGSAIQVLWRLAPGVELEVAESEHPELEDWWEALADAAGDLAELAEELGMDPAPLVAEWQALDVQRGELLALAAGAREAADDVMEELVDLLGSNKAVADLLGVPQHTVSNARQRAMWLRWKRKQPEE